MGKMSNEIGKLYTTTSFRHGGRRVGMGVWHDDYSETSGNPNYEKHDRVRFPHDNIDPKQMNGECIIVQKGRKKNEVD